MTLTAFQIIRYATIHIIAECRSTFHRVMGSSRFLDFLSLVRSKGQGRKLNLINYSPSSRQQLSMQHHHTTSGFLAVECHLGGWWQIVAKLFCAVLFAMPTVQYLGATTVPCLGTSTVPCLGTLILPVLRPGHVCSPCLHGTLASFLSGNACQCACPPWACLQSISRPRTLASSLPRNSCQFPAWDALPVPCLGTFANVLPGHHVFVSPCPGCLPVPCLGRLFAGTLSLAELFSYAYRTNTRRELRLFKPEMPRTPVPCYFCFCN